MAAHLAQAVANAVDVAWWSDHDHRMSADGYRDVVHFTSLTTEKPAPGEGGLWTWLKRTGGSLTTASKGGIATDISSPLDTVPGSSLHVRAQSTSRNQAWLGFYADSKPARYNYRSNLAGQDLYLEVLPAEIGPRGYLEVLISSSYHPATGGRKAGAYQLSYRFGGSGDPNNPQVNGLRGIITVPIIAGAWNSVVLRPTDDISALWPDMNARDFGLFDLNLTAISTGDVASGYFDFLRFSRQTGGNIPLLVQQDAMVAYAERYAGVTQHQGLELSFGLPHFNWFGGGVFLPDYAGAGVTTNAQNKVFLREELIPNIHARGGWVSYNHPFGTGSGAPLSPAAQGDKLAATARDLLAYRAYGADLIEVGYESRGGADLAHHLALWDILSRNGVFLTGNGVNDDHAGRSWLHMANNWITSVWAASTEQDDLLAALAAGRAWCGPLSSFRGSLDLVVDEFCPMGSVSVSQLPSRSLKLIATGLPSGGMLQVVQGVVDYAGTQDLNSRSEVTAAYSEADLFGGNTTHTISTHESCFVRTQVLDASGKVVGLSNPVWLLRALPKQKIPQQRAC